MMSSVQAAGGDAASVSSAVNNHAINVSEEKPRRVQRRVQSSEAGKRQRSSVSESVSWYCLEFANMIMALSQALSHLVTKMIHIVLGEQKIFRCLMHLSLQSIISYLLAPRRDTSLHAMELHLLVYILLQTA